MAGDLAARGRLSLHGELQREGGSSKCEHRRHELCLHKPRGRWGPMEGMAGG